MRAGTFQSRRTLTLTLINISEYVAPLGSSSLIFNFLFARFLVGTPVTRNDIYVCVFLHALSYDIMLSVTGNNRRRPWSSGNCCLWFD